MRYSFADLSVSDQRPGLQRDAQALALGGKLHVILLALLERAGEVVDKKLLCDLVWPEETVSDAVLAKQVGRLRTVLEDAGAPDTCIETHRGMGYRFTLPVKTGPEFIPAGPIRKSPTGMRRVFSIAWVLVVITAAGVYGWYSSLRASPSPPFTVAFVADQAQATELARYVAMLAERADVDALVYESPSASTAAVAAVNGGWVSASAEVTLLTDSTLAIVLRDDSGRTRRKEWKNVYATHKLDEVAQWLMTHLGIKANNRRHRQSIDEFALRSYFNGHQSESLGQVGQARDYYLSALNASQDFPLAARALAEKSISAGHYKELEALAKRMLVGNLEPGERVYWEFTRAKALGWRGFEEEAMDWFARAESDLGGVRRQFTLLQLYADMADWAEGHRNWTIAERHWRNAILLADLIYPSARTRANMRLRLAEMYRKSREAGWSKLAKQIEVVEPAQPLLEVLDDSLLAVKAYCLLLEGYLYTGQFNRTNRVVQRGLPHVQRLSDSSHDRALFSLLAAVNASYQGDFDNVRFFTEMLEADYKDNPEPLRAVYIAYAKLQQYYMQRDFAKAREMAQSALDVLPPTHPRYFWAKSILLMLDAHVAPIDELQDHIKWWHGSDQGMAERPREVTIAEGLLNIRQGNVKAGLDVMAKAEAHYRKTGETRIADYVVFDMLYILLDHPDLDYSMWLNRVSREDAYSSYPLLHLRARFALREGDLKNAILLLHENKRTGGQLWTAADQALLDDLTKKLGQKR